MNTKLKISLIAVFVLAFGLGGFWYFQRQNSTKTEIVNQQESAVKDDSKPDLPTAESDLPAENPTAEPEKPAVVPPPEKKAAEPVTPPKKAETPKSGEITKKLVNFGFQTANNRKIDTIIVHSSYNALGGDPFSVDKILDIYKSYGVAAHYLIDRQGTIYQLVEDKNIAYHAGVAKLPDGRTNVNEASIGIEMINTKTDNYTDAQYKAVDKLVEILKGRYKIQYVLGHDEIAPGRKDDPWNFDWEKIDR